MTDLPKEPGLILFAPARGGHGFVFTVLGCQCRCYCRSYYPRSHAPVHQKQHYTLREAEHCSTAVRARALAGPALKVVSGLAQKG